MRVWRLCRRKHAAFDGEGSRLFGGRWSRPGVAVVYTSATASLAALEYLVHVDPDQAPGDLVLIAAEVPGGVAVAEIEPGELPPGWRTYPAPESLAELGTRWAASGSTTVLRVPSAVLPEESNFILKPAHPDFQRIAVGPPQPFAFDPRLWKGPGRRRP